MVYKPAGRKGYRCDVIDHDKVVRSGCATGCTDRTAARAVGRMVADFRARRVPDEMAALRLITARRTTLVAVYDAYQTGELAAFVARHTAPPIVDLDPLVAAWAKDGAPAAYVQHVRRLIPDGVPFPLTQFTRGRIAAHLAALKSNRRRLPGNPTEGRDTSGATKNRHKASVSAFSAWLIEGQHVPDEWTNPTRDIKRRPEAPPRKVYLTRRQAQAYLKALPADGLAGQLRGLSALMANGVEWGAVEHGYVRDLDFDATPHPTFHAFPGLVAPAEGEQAGKNQYRRDRIVELLETWTLPYLRAYVDGLPPNAPLASESRDALYREHQKRLTQLGLPAVRLHDWRHSFIRWSKDARRPDDQIKANVGHAPNSPLMHTTYGVRRYDRTQGGDA